MLIFRKLLIFFVVALLLFTFLVPLGVSSSNVVSVPLVRNLDVGSTIGSNSVLYLDFDENTGAVVYDSSVNGYRGTLMNFNFTAQDGWVNGKRGSGLKFDGQKDYVLVENSGNLSANFITLEAWVYIDSNKDNMVLHKDGVFHLSVDIAGNIGFFVVVNGEAYGSWSFAPASLSARKWHYIAATYDGFYMRAYADGVLVGSSTFPGVLSLSSKPVSIGVDAVRGLGYFSGIIDDVRIYNQSLSWKEVWEHYSAEANGFIDFSPLISWSYYSNGNQQIKVQIQVGTSENDNSLWDFEGNSTNTWLKYAGLALSTNVNYYVRLRAYDGSVWSDWTSTTFEIIRQPVFQLSNLIIEPKQVTPGGTVHISFNVTNVGEGRGSYPAVFVLDGIATDTKIVTLNPGESKRVTFTIKAKDTFSFDIGGIQGNFEVVSFFPSVYSFLIATFAVAMFTCLAILVRSKLKTNKVK